VRGHPQAQFAFGIHRSVIATAVIAAFALCMAIAAGDARAAAWVSAGNFAANGTGAPVPSPTGLAVDQTADQVYVSNLFGAEFPEPGVIVKAGLDGSPGSPGTFGAGMFDGVAVDPVTGNVYALSDAAVIFGAGSAIQAYTPAGAAVGSPIPVAQRQNGDGGRTAQIASGPTGTIYYPNSVTDVVQRFQPNGTEILPAINGSGANALSNPNSVAVDSTGNVYVVDDSGGGRTLKFDSSGAFVSVIDSGSTGIGLDPGTGTVFVVKGQGTATHVVAYSAAGTELDDFGLGDFSATNIPWTYSQVAVDSGTGRVYVTDPVEGSVEMYDAVSPPAVTTNSATGVTQSGATLNATVNAQGAEADCEFVYDTDSAFGSPDTVPCVPDPVIGSATTPVSAVLSGSLSANTTYYFHVKAENPGGATTGSDQQFTTLPNAPAAKTDPASGIAQATATLNGTVNASGASTTCKFEYGTTTSYGKSAPCSVDPVTGSTDTAVSAALSGLAAGTTYHYRVSTTNAGGTTNGSDATFATLADTCATNPALCPPAAPPAPPVATPPVTTPPPAAKPLKCKKGFKKKTVKGKKKCVKVKKRKKSRKG